MIITLIKNLEFKKLLFILPINIASWIILAILFLFQRKPKDSLAICKGIFSAFFSLPKTLKKRKKIQSKRKISDQELFTLVAVKRGLNYYFNKAISYVSGKPF